MSEKQRSNSPERLDVIKSRHQALAILSLLSGEAGGTCNDAIFLDWLRQWGLGTDRDSLRTLLRNLEKDGAVQLSDHAGVTVIRLTQRGDDLVRGYSQSDLVLKPLPGDFYESLRSAQ